MKRVVFAVVPPVQIMDLTGPFEVMARCGDYRVELVTSSTETTVTSSCGLLVDGARYYERVRGPIDTLLIPGGGGAEQLACEQGFLTWVANQSRRVRRVGSICTGAFILAESGVLKNRRATTHWAWGHRLSERYPDVRVTPDFIFVKDEHVYTSAGVSAGIDLALSLVTEDFGRQQARAIARDLVVFIQRAGGQSQFSELLALPEASNRSIEKLLEWIPRNLQRPLKVDALAEKCAMSPRHFARVFVREVGCTPAAFIERSRVSASCRFLEESGRSLKAIADRCGFRTTDAMRLSFRRLLGITPSQYRQLHCSGQQAPALIR